jgi:hypothetical protein
MGQAVWLLKGDGTISVYKHPIFEVPADGASQHPSFDFSAE